MIVAPNAIVQWLESETEGELHAWVHWLEGDDPPPDVDDRNPNPPLWFVEAVIMSADPREARKRLAQRLSVVLKNPLATLLNPTSSIFRRPVQALDNLFHVCVELQ